MRSLTLSVAVLLVIAGVAAGGSIGGADVASAQPEATCAYPLSTTDATGTELTVEEEPDRIVALAPSDAQMTWAIGADEKVVGMPVSQYTDYLDDRDHVEDVTGDDGLTVTNEEVIGLEPDLVLAANTTEDDVEQLRDAGLTVYHFDEATSIDDVYEQTLLTGELAGECDGAEDTVEWMQAEIATVEEAVEGEDRPLAFYAMGDGFTAGEGTFIDEVIATAGADNLGSGAGVEFYGQLSEEVIVEEDPDWIVYPDSFEQPDVSEGVAQETTAMREDRTVTVNANYMNQPGPRIVLAIAGLTETFHPDAYEATTEPPEEALDETSDEDESPTEDDQPGFGIVAGLAGVIVGGLIAARRRWE